MDWAAFENNIIELVSSDAPFGMNFTGPAVAPFTFLEAVIRRNSIRNVDGIVNATGLPGGIQVSSCEGLIQEENILDLLPMQSGQTFFTDCGQTDFFANQTSAGMLIQGYNRDTSTSVDELSTHVEDSAICAF